MLGSFEQKLSVVSGSNIDQRFRVRIVCLVFAPSPSLVRFAEIVFFCAREFSGRSEPRVWNCGDLLFD